MATLSDFNRYGEEIQKLMLLRTYPIAVKMLEKESDIPKGALRPKRDRGYHLAQCQAFSLSRRQGNTVAMLKEDNWCWGALMAYGLVDPRVAEHYPELKDEVKKIPAIEHGRYVGVVSAPLKTSGFLPDIVLIYSNNAQLNNMLHALSFKGEGVISSPLYAIASCAFSVVPALSGQYCVTLPDPGELGRALAGEDEIIFSVPKEKMEGLVSQLKMFEERGFGYRHHAFLEMRPDFPRPEFYKKLFRECGLDADDIPTWPVQ
ncbi:MAG: DUF169 domain-containing protein [Acidobacteria bacterium]|nr:DUF169 domain-containing protein [Acidobacteriota bacterium]